MRRKHALRRHVRLQVGDVERVVRLALIGVVIDDRTFADHHFRTRKEVAGGRTFVSLAALDAEERVEEVARMLAGQQITDLSRSHARDLIASGAAE